MSLFKWFERKLFTGDVIQDYGEIQDERIGIGRFRTSMLLCRRKGRLQFMLKLVGTAPLGASVNYVHINATSQSLERLGVIILDAKRHLDAEPPKF